MLSSFEALQMALKKRREHTSEPKPVGDIDLIRTLGINETAFNEQLDRLCKMWWGRDALIPQDLDAKRFVTSIIGSHLNDPAIVSIMVDDISNFERQSKSKGDRYYFDFCCLCGAENIIKSYFLGNPDKKNCLISSENPIGFVVSSGNAELAMSLAREAIALGRTNLGLINIYAFGNERCAAAILEMLPNAIGTRCDSASTGSSSLGYNNSASNFPKSPTL